MGERTFWEQSIVAVLCIASQEPPVAEIVVALNELDAVAASEAQLVWTPRLEFVCRAVSVAGWHLPFQCRLWSEAARAESGITYARRRECRPDEPRRWDSWRPWRQQQQRRGGGGGQRENSGCCWRLPPALDIKCSSCSREVGAAAAQTWRCQWCRGRSGRVQQQRHKRQLSSGAGERGAAVKGACRSRWWCWQRVGEAL